MQYLNLQIGIFTLLYFFLRTLILKIRHIFGRWILVRWNKYKEGRKGKKNIFILVKNIESSEYLYTTSKNLKAF